MAMISEVRLAQAASMAVGTGLAVIAAAAATAAT
jgi:hypothetical protein